MRLQEKTAYGIVPHSSLEDSVQHWKKTSCYKRFVVFSITCMSDTAMHCTRRTHRKHNWANSKNYLSARKGTSGKEILIVSYKDKTAAASVARRRIRASTARRIALLCIETKAY